MCAPVPQTQSYRSAPAVSPTAPGSANQADGWQRWRRTADVRPTNVAGLGGVDDGIVDWAERYRATASDGSGRHTVAEGRGSIGRSGRTKSGRSDPQPRRQNGHRLVNTIGESRSRECVLRRSESLALVARAVSALSRMSCLTETISGTESPEGQRRNCWGNNRVVRTVLLSWWTQLFQLLLHQLLPVSLQLSGTFCCACHSCCVLFRFVLIYSTT